MAEWVRQREPEKGGVGSSTAPPRTKPVLGVRATTIEAPSERSGICFLSDGRVQAGE